MGTAIGEILPLAMGVALSPVPIIAVILMMVSRKGKVNGPLFAFGWFVGVVLLSTLVILLAIGHDYSEGSGPSSIVSLVRLLLGLLFLLIAFRAWKSRPKPGEHIEMPKWMHALDRLNPIKAFVFGVVFVTFNGKNFPATVAAATIIAQEGLAMAQTMIAVIIFAIIATLGVAAPVLVTQLGGDKAQPILDEWKLWLSDHNSAIMFVLFLILGLMMFGKGLGGLF